jgi:hypothetical protein
MKEELIKFETARLAKEKGFIGYKSNKHYRVDEMCLIHGLIEDYVDHNLTKNYLSAPPQSVIQKWLRDTHRMEIKIDYPDGFWKYIANTNFNLTPIKNGGIGFNTYELALEEAIILGLRNVSETVA